jgi:hypothetical protein
MKRERKLVQVQRICAFGFTNAAAILCSGIQAQAGDDVE